MELWCGGTAKSRRSPCVACMFRFPAVFGPAVVVVVVIAVVVAVVVVPAEVVAVPAEVAAVPAGQLLADS